MIERLSRGRPGATGTASRRDPTGRARGNPGPRGLRRSQPGFAGLLRQPVLRVLLLGAAVACGATAADLAAAPAVANTTAAATAPAARPKIGLVLSGGGARGLTHIGVLRVLEEMRIPIDYVAATSMGAIVGGLHASGMSATEMERTLATTNWSSLFSDSPPGRELGLRRKEEETRFPLPFEFGVGDGKIKLAKGALTGSNLELLLHEFVRKVDDIETFDQLPIPFRAIATDLETGSEVVFDRGPLHKAMRASMSVPGMFAPAEIDGRILGDGGLVKNLPVDVVRAMGADIVIAVNIGTPLLRRDQLSSAFGVASQMINILTEQNVRGQLALLRPDDILISPDLGELTFGDFDAGPKFIALGREAALAQSPRLAALGVAATQYAMFQAQLAAPAFRPPKVVDFVRIEGTELANPEVLAQQMDTRPGEPFDVDVLHRDLNRLYGRGDIEQIDYRLADDGRFRGVVVQVREKSWGPDFLRFGLALDSDLQGETSFNLLFGHKRSWVNSLGGEWDNEVELGRIRRYGTEFYQPLNVGNWLFASAYATAQAVPEYIFLDGNRIAEYDVSSVEAGLDGGTQFGNYGEARLGFRYYRYKARPEVAVPGFPRLDASENGARLLVRWDSLDHPYFPERGNKTRLELFAGRRRISLGGTDLGESGVQRGSLETSHALAVERGGLLHLGLRIGGVASDRTDIISDFNLGGFLNLSGYRTDQATGNYVGFGRAVYYHRVGTLPVIGRGIYVGGSLEAGNVWPSRSEFERFRLVPAGSVFLAADTKLGPFYLAYGRASHGNQSFYLVLGRP
jgi:NTE family protein